MVRNLAIRNWGASVGEAEMIPKEPDADNAAAGSLFHTEHALRQFSSMTVYINDKATELDKELNLSDLLIRLDVASSGIALAINDRVIPKQEWESKYVSHQDKVIIIKATQGG